MVAVPVLRTNEPGAIPAFSAASITASHSPFVNRIERWKLLIAIVTLCPSFALVAFGRPEGYEFFTEGEYVHQRLLDPAALARASIAAHRSISASNGSASSSSMPSASIRA